MSLVYHTIPSLLYSTLLYSTLLPTIPTSISQFPIFFSITNIYSLYSNSYSILSLLSFFYSFSPLFILFLCHFYFTIHLSLLHSTLSTTTQPHFSLSQFTRSIHPTPLSSAPLPPSPPPLLSISSPAEPRCPTQALFT